MATTIFVPPFKDPQLRQFAQQVVQNLGLIGGTTTQVGAGNPTVKKTDVAGDTYWNSVDNNFWIFNSDNWTPLNVLEPDTKTGEIKAITGEVVGYLYKYMAVKYADTAAGGGISDAPTNKSYYGISNTNIQTESTNPDDYQWAPVAGGFGTTKFLYYATTGGRAIQFKIDVVIPGEGFWERVPTIVVDLDVISNAPNRIAVTASTVFIPPRLNGQWVAGDTAVFASTNYNSGVVENYTATVSVDTFGRLSGVNTSFKDTQITFVGNGTQELQVTFTNNVGTATTQVVAGFSDITQGNNITYPFQYLRLAFADNILGTIGFTLNPTGKRYLGVYNGPATTFPTDPTFFSWFDLGVNLDAGNNSLWFRMVGNRVVNFVVGYQTVDTALYTDYSTLFSTLGFTGYLDLDSRSGFVIVRGTDTGGNYSTTPAATSDGSLAYSLPFKYDFGGEDNKTIGSVTSLTIDRQGRVTGFAALDRLASNTLAGSYGTGPFAFPHTVGQALVFLNGFLLQSGDFTETATNITIATARATDRVIAWRFTETNASGITPYVPFVNVQLATVEGQSTYTVGNAAFVAGNELLFLNGVFLRDTDYDYSSDRTQILLNEPPVQNGVLLVVCFRLLSDGVATAVVPFVQGFGTTTAPTNQLQSPNNLQQTAYTMVLVNGVVFEPVNDYTTAANSKLVNLTSTTPIAGYDFEATAFSATSLSSGLNNLSSAAVARIEVGSLLKDGSKVIEMGDEDPSIRGVFTKVEAPKSIAQQFYEMHELISDLQVQINQIKGGTS